MHPLLRTELSDFYRSRLNGKFKDCCERSKSALDAAVPGGLNAFEEKRRQYAVIAETVEPVLFRHTDFYYEVCANDSVERPQTPGMWTYRKNRSDYSRLAEAVLAEKNACTSVPLYTFCGEFGDEMYHFAFENEKVLQTGFRGLYEKISGYLAKPGLTERQTAFYRAAADGCLSMKRVAERFSEKARELADAALSADEKRHYEKIAETARKIPWEKPSGFYEALEAVLFIEQVLPALEGGGLYTVGRLDRLLWEFYRSDLEAGALTREQAYALICEFLILFDSRIDHDSPDQSDSLVCAVYTLGGCDEDGKPFYNELTELFLRANREENIIYPKIKCRFGKDSPGEYLNLINAELASGKSTLLYVNDDAMLPALRRAGIGDGDARNYSLLGCWEPVVPGCSNEHCAYMNLIKILELSVWGGYSHEALPFEIRPIDGAEDFEDVLETVLADIEAVFASRSRVAVGARRYWSEIDPHPLISCALDDCLARGRDLTEGGAKYNLDEIICAGLPNVIDSLLVIRDLCFEKKTVTLPALLHAVRSNWADDTPDMAALRSDALRCHFFGDASVESMSLTERVTDFIAECAEKQPSLWGGRMTVGYMLFMELYRWAKGVRATPDGRHNGDLFARGLTPSSLHHIESVTDVLTGLSAIDPSGVAADSVLNITLPYHDMPLPIWEAFLRTAAGFPVQALQINCVTKEELLDARIHPEAHSGLIVRVCGYSAKFTSLPRYVQDDFLQRNFFEK